MKIKFYGVRGSLPTGLTAEEVESKIVAALEKFVQSGLTQKKDIPAFLEQLPHHAKSTMGGNTTCLKISTEDGFVIVDSGTGIRQLGLEHFQQVKKYHLFQTHFHWDHTAGLPFFNPIYIPGYQIHFYSPYEDFAEHIKVLFRHPNFPVAYEWLASAQYFHHIEKYDATQLFGMNISALELDHPNGSFGYHFEQEGKTLMVCVDTELKRMSRESMGQDLPYYQNLDMLVFDGQYTINEVLQKQDWGHCSAHVGVDLCLREGIKKLVVTHHDPLSTDEKLYELSQEVQAYHDRELNNLLKDNPKATPVEIIWAYEGMELEV